MHYTDAIAIRHPPSLFRHRPIDWQWINPSIIPPTMTYPLGLVPDCLPIAPYSQVPEVCAGCCCQFHYECPINSCIHQGMASISRISWWTLIGDNLSMSLIPHSYCHTWWRRTQWWSTARLYTIATMCRYRPQPTICVQLQRSWTAYARFIDR